jgi:radial spoke head protein 1
LKNINREKDKNGKEFDDGHFVKGRLEGMGQILYENGEKYEGSFKDGKRSGFGLMIYVEPDGEYGA